MQNNIYISLIVMFLSIYAVRALPITLLRKEIKNRFFRSFLHYVPYVSLSVMTFPSILHATNSVWSGLAGFVTGVLLAWTNGNLFGVAIGSCVAVYLVEFFI